MTLLDFIRLTRAHLKLLLIATAAGILLAGAYTAFQPTLYTSTSTGVVTAGGAGSIGEAQASSGLATARAGTYAALAGSQGVRARIADKLGPEGLGSFAAAPGSIPSVINFSATASSPEAARDQANALAIATAGEAVAFEKLGSKAEPVVRIVPMEDANLPGAPSSPNWLRNLLAGLGLGLIAGLAFILVRRATDSRVRTTHDVEELTGASAMTVIPLSGDLESGTPGSHSPAAEALRQLRTNLRFVDVDNPPRSIVITSAQPGEGKSTVASNLGRLLAESGIPTVVVDADLRKPTQATRFGVDGTIGLTQVLAGDVKLADALVATDVARLKLLPAGRIPPNPSELLGSHRMGELVEELSGDHMVILDTTPMLPVTDAGLLTATCDGALLVMAVGRTHKEQIRHCAKVIAQVNGNLLGSVLNKASQNDIGSVYYGAGYGSYGSDYYGYVEGGKKGKGKRSAGKRGATAGAQDGTPSRSQDEAVVVPEAPVAPARPVMEPAREVVPVSVAETTVTPQQSAGDQAYRPPVEPDAFGVEPEVQAERGRRAW